MDVLQRILELRNRRGWTEWRLADISGVSQSTISAWYKKGRSPSISSLEKICTAFDMTLCQFFAADNELVDLTAEQRQMLDNWNALSERQKGVLMAVIQEIPHRE